MCVCVCVLLRTGFSAAQCSYAVMYSVCVRVCECVCVTGFGAAQRSYAVMHSVCVHL